VKLNGQVDAVVLAGGIGEKSALLRQTLADKLQCLGVTVDAAANDKGPADGETVKDISAGGGKGPRVLVCQTNEQVSVSQSRRSMIQSVCREVQPFWRCLCSSLDLGLDFG
jgi:acetate kinase